MANKNINDEIEVDYISLNTEVFSYHNQLYHIKEKNKELTLQTFLIHIAPVFYQFSDLEYINVKAIFLNEKEITKFHNDITFQKNTIKEYYFYMSHFDFTNLKEFKNLVNTDNPDFNTLPNTINSNPELLTQIIKISEFSTSKFKLKSISQEYFSDEDNLQILMWLLTTYEENGFIYKKELKNNNYDIEFTIKREYIEKLLKEAYKEHYPAIHNELLNTFIKNKNNTTSLKKI